MCWSCSRCGRSRSSCRSDPGGPASARCPLRPDAPVPSAVMIWLFMLLGAAFRGGLGSYRWAYVWAAVALAGSYVAATTVNDIADEAIDQVNHPVDRGRPLVSGEASVRDLRALHVVGVAVAVVAGAALGRVGLGLSVLSVTIGRMYSVPPVRLSVPNVPCAHCPGGGLRGDPLRVRAGCGRRLA